MSEELKEKIMSKVQIDPETGCWIWLNKLIRGCQVRMSYKRNNINVRKYLFETYYGEFFDPNIYVSTKCKNSLCVCPDHLVLNKSGGNSPPSKDKTLCKYGHSLEDAIISKRGSRVCRKCQKIRNAKRIRTKG